MKRKKIVLKPGEKSVTDSHHFIYDLELKCYVDCTFLEKGKLKVLRQKDILYITSTILKKKTDKKKCLSIDI